MKKSVSIILGEGPIVMRSFELKDIEYLRKWKNAHKEYFFLKEEITATQQLSWFNLISERQDDYMFIIEKGNNPIGCIGARIFEGFVDVYNVILGDKNYKGLHIMTNAMLAVVAYCKKKYKNLAIRVRVLKNNPAMNWYEKIGYTIIDDSGEHTLMEFEEYRVFNPYIEVLNSLTTNL